MFGLEGQKKNGHRDEFVFELEKELKDTKKHQQLKQRVEDQIQKIKDSLRTGESQDEFDRLGLLLHGYTSLLKVMSRFSPK